MASGALATVSASGGFLPSQPNTLLRFDCGVLDGVGLRVFSAYVRRKKMEATMHSSADLLGTLELSYEEWRDMLRPNWGLYTPDNPKGFAGRVRSRRICGLNASDISN